MAAGVGVADRPGHDRLGHVLGRRGERLLVLVGVGSGWAHPVVVDFAAPLADGPEMRDAVVRLAERFRSAVIQEGRP